MSNIATRWMENYLSLLSSTTRYAYEEELRHQRKIYEYFKQYREKQRNSWWQKIGVISRKLKTEVETGKK